MKPKILIVEDEPAISDNIQYVLENEGLETILANRAGVVPSLLRAHAVDLILMDVGLPDMTGFDLLREIRRDHGTPIIFLTARNTEIDRVLGLEMGADDYVSKPFSPRELAARVKVVLRRGKAPVAAAAKYGSFVVDESRRQIGFRGQTLELSKIEYDILMTFVRRPGNVFSRDQLMTMVWDSPEATMDRAVDAHIGRIRAKLRAIAPDVELIVTHRGSGYSLRDDA